MKVESTTVNKYYCDHLLVLIPGNLQPLESISKTFPHIQAIFYLDPELIH